MSTLSPTTRRLRLLVSGIAIAAVVSACGSEDSTDGVSATTAESATSTSQADPGEPAEAAVTVDVTDMKFSPADITVKTGETVTWKFDDRGVPHTVTGLKDVGMAVNSPIQKDGEYSHVFDKPGKFDYICTIHPDMRGTVTVE